MRIWQANLGRGASRATFGANLRAVLSAGGPRAVYMWQEIDEADTPNEMDLLLDLTSKTHHPIGESTHVPILVPRHLPVLSTRITRACAGLPGFTPARQIVEAVIALPGRDVALLGTHVPILKRQTLTRRTSVRKALRARTRHHGAGVWAADTNTRHMWPSIAPGEVEVISAGIDRAKAWAEPDTTIEVTERRTVRLSIDGHDAHGARIWWE